MATRGRDFGEIWPCYPYGESHFDICAHVPAQHHPLYLNNTCIEFVIGYPLRCTLSYPNWVFVFMASVNYTSRCHQDAMALF